MALGATVYNFKIELADSDRGVYAPLDLRVARHPSETEDHLLTRVLAYCLEYGEGIGFSNGLSDSDQPAISVRDLTGALRVWIDVGAPEAARLHRAAKLAPRVAVYTHKDAEQLAARLGAEKIHRAEALELYAVDRDWLAALSARLARRMEFALTVADRHVYLSLGVETFSFPIQRHVILSRSDSPGPFTVDAQSHSRESGGGYHRSAGLTRTRRPQSRCRPNTRR